jgi:small subunit ribosomal protein S3
LGRKVHPTGFRLGITKKHQSRWYAEGKDYSRLIAEDRVIRKEIHSRLSHAGVSKIEIERAPKLVHLTIHAAKPGVVIGRKGVTVTELRKDLGELTGKRVKIDVEEIKKPELDASLVAENIAEQLARRVAHKRAMRRAAERTMRSGAKGIMIRLGGRLGGSEMPAWMTSAWDAFPGTPCAPTSTMSTWSPAPPMASSASRCGSTRVIFCPANP